MRERTETEKDYIWGRIVDQCMAGGYSERGAMAEGYKVLDLLPLHTEQPLSAARWLEQRVSVKRWAA